MVAIQLHLCYPLTMENVINSVYLAEIIDKVNLTQRELDVLEFRYCHKTTLKEIGIELGVCPERVRQIEAKVLRKLRIMCNLMDL